jgi:hypothetical protein
MNKLRVLPIWFFLGFVGAHWVILKNPKRALPYLILIVLGPIADSKISEEIGTLIFAILIINWIYDLYLIISGKVKINEPRQMEGVKPSQEKNTSTKNEAEDSQKPFVFAIIVSADEANDMFEENNNSAARDALCNCISKAISALRARVDESARFYFNFNDKRCEIQNDDQLYDLFAIESVDQVAKIKSKIENGIITFMMLVNECEHWDYNFIKASEYEGIAFSVVGYHPSTGAISKQAYDNGDYDTGIESNYDEKDLYSGNQILERFGFARDEFDSKNYLN